MGKEVQIINTNMRESFQKNLDTYKVDYRLLGDIFYISSSMKNKALLIKILVLLNFERNLIYVNIANEKTTRTLEGGCYLRKVITLDDKKNPKVEIDAISQTRLVYDPTHPDAMRDGVREGYVEYPNVCVQSEMFNLTEVNNEINTILEIIKKIDPSIIIPQNDTKFEEFLLKQVNNQ